MTARKLTPEEVERLFDFCRKHYVPEYDLQVELVDHLASSVEDQWIKNPEVPFPVALINSFDQFGVFGFSKIKERKEKELRRKYRRLFWKYTFDFYKLPKVLLTFAITVFLYTLFKLVNSFYWVAITYFIFMLAFMIYYHFWLFPKHYKIPTTQKTQFLLINYLKNKQSESALILQIPIQGSAFLHDNNYSYLNHSGILFFTSMAITTLSILVYVNFMVLPTKIREHFEEQFPQYVKS
jgi:hypothetical protein